MENENKQSEFKEERVILDQPVIRSQPRKLNSKINRKTVLRKSGLKSTSPLQKMNPKKSNAEFLIESILKTYWTTKWREQINNMKFSKVGYNKKRADFRNLCMKLNHSIKYHHYLYLIKLFDNMEKIPLKPGVKHDDFYGKIKIVSKSTNKIEDKEKSDNGEKLMNIEDKADNNIIFDNIKITMDIPKLSEVEYNPERKLEIEKEKDNKIIIKGEVEIENESPQKLIKIKKEKKTIKKKNINNDNIIKIKEDNNNDNVNSNSKNKNKIENNNNAKHFIEILRDAIERVSGKKIINENILFNNKDIKEENIGAIKNEIRDESNSLKPSLLVEKNPSEKKVFVEKNNNLLDNMKGENKENTNKEIIISKEKKEEKIIDIQTSPQKMEIKIENEELSNKPKEEKVVKIIEEEGENKGTGSNIKTKGKKTFLKRKIKKIKEQIDIDEKSNKKES